MSRFPFFALALVSAVWVAAAGQGRAQALASFDELVHDAQQAQQQNDLSTAAAKYKQALALRPEIAELHANLGLVNYELGDDNDASHEFETALRLKPALFVPNLFLGVQSLKRNDPSAALTYLLRAVRLNPRDLEVNLSLGRAYTALNRQSEAISAYANAVRFHPDNESGWYGLGTSYLDRAGSLSRLLAKRYTDSTASRALAADYFEEEGKYSRAVSEYREIVSRPDAPACSHSRLGFALIHSGQADNAAAEFNADLQLPGCAALARIGLASVRTPNGNAPAALDQSLQSLPSKPADIPDPNPQSTANGASGAYLNGRYKTAASLGEKAIAGRTLSADTLYWTIRAYQQLGVSALTQAVTIAPNSLRIHLLLGDSYRRRGQYVTAEQEFQAALKLDATNVPALLGLATCRYLDGDFSAAEQSASQGLAYKPGDPELRLLMAEIRLSQHRYQEAYGYVETVPNGKPDLVAEIHGVRGKIFAAMHRPDDAISELKKAIDNDPQGDLTYVLARQYQLVGDKQAAEVAFQRSKMLRRKFNEGAGYKPEDKQEN